MPRVKQFPRLNYQFKRAIQELLSEGNLSQAEWNSILQYFKSKCVYCGVADTGNPRTGLVADHLLPAIQNGDLVLGNTVPACHDCNDLRGKTEWRLFLKENFSDKAMERIQSIERYLELNPYQPPMDPVLRLTSEERLEYEAILNDWNSLLEKARLLRCKIKNRKKNRGVKGEMNG